MSWRKMWLVLRREYTYNFRRPSFLFTAFGVPLISLAAMVLLGQFLANRETSLDDFQRIGYIDRAMILDPAVDNPAGYYSIVAPGSVPIQTNSGMDLGGYFDEQETYARLQLQDEAIDAYFVLPSNYVLSGRVDLYARENVPEALREDVEDFLAHQIANRAPADLPVPVERLTEAELTIRDVDSGDELSEAALIGRFMLPLIFVILYFMATNITAQFLMSGVVEEKENRLMEILATSLRPSELLWGKLLGLGALALTQVFFWALAGFVLASLREEARDFISGVAFQPGDIALMIMLFVINFILFSASMLGIGASVTAEAESRQVAGLFTFMTVLPLALTVTFVTNPDGPLPVFFTFFPYTGAVALIMRLAFTSVPSWQIGFALAIQFVSVVVVMWLAAKIFRLGMLMYGKPLTPRTLINALREGRVTLTTASTEYAPGPAGAQRRQRKGIFGR